MPSSLISGVAQCLGLSLVVVGCASGPPAPTPWFNEGLAINNAVLPQGVEFGIVKDYSNKSVDFTDNLLITNSSSTPLMLKALPPPEGGYYREILCPGGFCLKADMGRAYVWRIPRFGPDGPLSWQAFDEFDESAPLDLYIFGRALGTSDYKVLWIESPNLFTDDRPPDARIPLPQVVNLPYMYGSSEMTVPLTISYSFNEAYAPYQPLPTIVCLAPLVLGLLLAFVVSIILFNRFLALFGRRA